MNRIHEIEPSARAPRAVRGSNTIERGLDTQHLTEPERAVFCARQGYELWAPRYDLNPNPLVALEERTLAAVLVPLTGKNALDVATGTGRWLETFVEAGARRAIGIDLSFAMLEVAAAKLTLRGRLACADGLALPLPSTFADFLIVSFAVRHFAELSLFARELARVAAVGADCYLTDLHPTAYARGWRTGFRHPGGRGEILTYSHSRVDICDAFSAQGFDLIRAFEPCIGEPEKPVFARARKLDRFADVAGIPAILICHFRRLHHRTKAL